MADKIFSTIHIFGFGVSQAIGKDKNVQVDSSAISTELDPVVSLIWSKKPANYVGTPDYHAINIFNGLFADWLPKTKGEKMFRVNMNQLNADEIDALANAIFNSATPPTT